jgi:hypothetical protein
MYKLLIIVCASIALLAGCSGNRNLGAATANSSGGGSGSGTGTGTGTGTTTYSMGNGTGSSFQSGMIGISSTPVAAGGTTSLTVTVVDQTGTLYTAQSVTVTFISTCISKGFAKIAAFGTSTAGTTPGTVTSTSGTIDATYTATGCAGPDVITADATVASTKLTATGTLTVTAAAIGSIQFISATPATIGLKGTGLNETSTVVFKVVDSSGGPRPGVNVSFSLNTTAGGLSWSPLSQISGADGTVQTVVSSGTGHTSVIVTASIASSAHSTQSRALTVTTGLPASGAFSISIGPPSYGGPACPNVESYTLEPITVPFTVQLADRYNNPAPDGTSVVFVTDGGHIDGSCTTPLATSGDGSCKVTWTSANPRPTTSGAGGFNPSFRNGRAMILATAIGEESFNDPTQSGFYQLGDSFSDLGEPYLDDNESGAFVTGDYYLDFNSNHMWDGPSGTFKGITCSATTCTTTSLGIGVSHLLIMSTSAANIQVTNISSSLSPITHGTSAQITFTVQDLNGNPMPAGTTVTTTADSGAGTINGGSGANFTIGCRSGGGPTGPGADTLTANFTASSTAGGGGNIIITVTSPGTKTATPVYIPVTVN